MAAVYPNYVLVYNDHLLQVTGQLSIRNRAGAVFVTEKDNCTCCSLNLWFFRLQVPAEWTANLNHSGLFWCSMSVCQGQPSKVWGGDWNCYALLPIKTHYILSVLRWLHFWHSALYVAGTNQWMMIRYHWMFNHLSAVLQHTHISLSVYRCLDVSNIIFKKHMLFA